MSMTTGTIFFRHSLPVIDPAIPAREWRLSEEGQLRCRLLAGRLANFNPQRIVSSLEPKALETAQIVAETLGMPYESAVGLHEHVRSRTGHTSQEAFEASVKAFFEQPDQLVYGDETADQAHTRFTQAVEAIQDRYPGQTPLVIVTHGTVISLFVARACGVDPFSLWKSLKLPCMVVCSAHNPSIISLESPTPLSFKFLFPDT
jgi:broad specificity phosphatase PhoE